MNKTIAYLLLLSVALVPVHAQDQETLAHGLPWVFYNSTDFTRPDSDNGVDANINLDTGTTFNDYAEFWAGYLKAPAAGEITIEAEVDNGLRLTLNKKLVIDGWDADGARTATVKVTEGEYLPLQLEYFQDGGEAFLRLYWKRDGRERELIPASAFFHDQNDKDLIDRLKRGDVRVAEVRTAN